jgi:hypothetical protein
VLSAESEESTNHNGRLSRRIISMPDEELEHLRFLFARAHETGEPRSREVIRRMMALLGDCLKKKAAPKRIEPRENKDAA